MPACNYPKVYVSLRGRFLWGSPVRPQASTDAGEGKRVKPSLKAAPDSPDGVCEYAD